MPLLTLQRRRRGMDGVRGYDPAAPTAQHATDCCRAQQRYGDFADTVSRYLDQVKKLADTKREAAETQAKMLTSNAYRLADDPTKTSRPPTALKSVPHFNMAPLENAIDHLKRSAKAYGTALAANGGSQSETVKPS